MEAGTVAAVSRSASHDFSKGNEDQIRVLVGLGSRATLMRAARSNTVHGSRRTPSSRTSDRSI